MEYTKDEKHLKIKLNSDFNIVAVRKIENLLKVEETEEIDIDLSESKIVDSEAIKFIYLKNKEGIRTTIHHPPEILYEALRILELQDIFKKFIAE